MLLLLFYLIIMTARAKPLNLPASYASKRGKISRPAADTDVRGVSTESSKTLATCVRTTHQAIPQQSQARNYVIDTAEALVR